MSNFPHEKQVIVQIILTVPSNLPDAELKEAAQKSIFEYAKLSHSRDALASSSVSNDNLSVYHSRWTHLLSRGNCQVSVG